MDTGVPSWHASVLKMYYRDLLSSFDDTILSIVSENVCSHVVPKLKMDVLAIEYGRFR